MLPGTTRTARNIGTDAIEAMAGMPGNTGKDADAALSEAHITTNKNTVPNDPRPPLVTSGIRLGTPAVTTRGFGVLECELLAHWLCDVLEALAQDEHAQRRVSERVARQVTELCRHHPVYRRATTG